MHEVMSKMNVPIGVDYSKTASNFRDENNFLMMMT